MGALLLNVPDISDADLVLDEAETRGVLKAFWPRQAATIDALSIESGARRLAQTALIAAIDASYAMGFIEATFRSFMRPSSSVKSAIARLARNTSRHWWRHARGKNLTDAKLYDVIVSRLALSLRQRLDDLIAGLTAQRFAYSIHAA